MRTLTPSPGTAGGAVQARGQEVIPFILLSAREDGQCANCWREVGSNQGAYDIRAVDMDGDYDLDLLIAGHSSNNLVWFENPLP